MNSSASVAPIFSITYASSSNLFVAVGSYTYPVYAISNDGIHWTTPAPMNGDTTPNSMLAVATTSTAVAVSVGYTSGGFPIYAVGSQK